MSPCAYLLSKIAVIQRDLTWSRKSPKFSLDHLQNISTRFKMAVLTPKSGNSFLNYHESDLSLIARETMQLLANRQLIPIAIQPKSTSLEQICYKRSQCFAITSLHCLIFSTSKNKDLKRIQKSATNVELALNFSGPQKFFFPQ